MTEEMTIEEVFEALDDILSKMNGEDVALEDAFSYYEKGMKLLAECNGRLKSLESKVEKINASGALEDFAHEE